MAELLLLGTGAALTDGSREPTMLALCGRLSTVLIDCGSNVVRQLQRLGVPLDSVERLILTHAHPDHTSGFPLLMEMLWLGGLRGPLPVHGPEDALETVRRAFGQWDTSGWRDMPTLEWRPTQLREDESIATGRDFELRASPGQHGTVPVIAVRARALEGGGTVVYSSDGEPSQAVERLAKDADILAHEATGPYAGHSTAKAAAELAASAGARQLLLVHLAPNVVDLPAAAAEAAAVYPGPVFLGADLDRYEF
jgi:ribonuclease Z